MDLLASACSRNEEDLFYWHWAHNEGIDLYAQRCVYFDALVQTEQARREDRRLDVLLTVEAARRAEERSTALRLAYAQSAEAVRRAEEEATVLRQNAAPLPAHEPAAQARRADERATALLLENLTEKQRGQYTASRYFDVIGGQSGKRYRIWHRTMQNIEELDAFGRRVFVWCVHPVGVAMADVLLAQKMALELFETDAMRIARRYWDFSCSGQGAWCDVANMTTEEFRRFLEDVERSCRGG